MHKPLLKLAGLIAGALLLVIATGTLVRYELTRSIGEQDEGVLSYLAPSVLWLAELPKHLYLSLTNPFAFNLILPDLFPGHTGFVGTPNKEERYLLLSRADGDLGQGIVELIDLRTFEVRHEWVPDFRALDDEWNDRVAELSDTPQSIIPYALAMHPTIVGDGLIFNAYYGTMKKLDACSDLVWQTTPAPDVQFHHGLEVDIDGNFWSLGRNRQRLHPSIVESSAGRPYVDNTIVKLSSDGEVLFTKSISDILRENDLGYLLWGTEFSAYFVDWMHANDVQPAYSDTKYWKKGDLLISLHSPSLVFLYRPSTNQLIWHSVGYARAQHDPDFVDSSRISIFDNDPPFNTRPPRPPVDSSVVDKSVWSKGHSQVIIYDFATEKYSTYLNASLQENELRAGSQGRSEILPNGDLFLEETKQGRTLYFNADGSLRWSHVNRAKDGNVYVLAWSRILHRDHDVAVVRDFLAKKDELLAECKSTSL